MAFLKNKFFIFFVVLFLLIVAGGVTVWYLQSTANFQKSRENQSEQINKKEKDLFSGFSKLIINPAHAKDNFNLNPTQSDSLGVENTSSYILTSKEEIDLKVLKNNLQVSPEIEYEIKEITQKKWEIVPQEPVEPNALVNFSLSASYEDEQGEKKQEEYSWVYQVKDNFKVLHSIPGQAGTNVPLNTGIEVTFSHENFENYEEYFNISPKVKGKFEKHGRTLVFVPEDNLDASALYTVTIKKGLPVKNSENRLIKDHVFTFETKSREKVRNSGYNIAVYEKMMETNTEEPPLIQISGWNEPPKLDVDLYRFSSWKKYLETIKERDKLPWWSRTKDNFLYDTSKVIKVNSFDVPVKTSKSENYIQFPEALSSGFYLAELSYNGENKTQVWIQVSDLAVYYNITKTDTIVWVNNTVDSSPIDKAKIEVLGDGKSFKTDTGGVSRFATPRSLVQDSSDTKKTERSYFKISKNDNVLILPASQISRNHWWRKPEAEDDYWNYFYTDRPRYQPSDTIKFFGFLRNRQNKEIEDEITVTLNKQGYVDYYYRPVEIRKKTVKLSSQDSFEGEIKFEDLRPDYYTLELKAGEDLIKRKYINIKPYEKPAYDLTLIPEKRLAFAGEEVKLKAKASFFEGTPVPNLDLIFNTPEGEKEFTTNDEGEIDLTYSKDYNSCSRPYGCWPKYSSLSIRPKKSEVGDISARTYIRFYGPEVYVDLEEEYPEKGMAKIDFSSKYLDFDSMQDNRWWHSDKGKEPAPEVRIEGEIIKTTYEKVLVGTNYDFISKKTYKEYRYERREEKVKDFSFKTDNQGKHTLSQEVEPKTSYKVVYKYYDSQGRNESDTTYLYYYNGREINRYSNWHYNYYHFNLEGEKNEFSFGDRVNASFMRNDELMPSGKGNYLFLQMQNGLQEYETGKDPIYSFQFEKRDAPNVNIFGIYFNGKHYVETRRGHRGSPGKTVNFNTEDKRLKIKADTDKEEYKPGEEVNLSLQVTDKDDNPVKAEVNLNLVDEAYYAVTEDTATPLSTLYSSVDDGSLLSRKTHASLAKESGAEKGGCFVAGTEVLMADGEKKKIEDIQEGDKIKTFSDPLSEELVSGEVVKIWKRATFGYLVINNKIKVTPEHQFFVNNQFMEAGLLKKGDWLLGPERERIKIRSLSYEQKNVQVYNLKVEPQNTYFANGAYVHNAEKGGGAREFFTDAALFKVVQTDNQGKAEVEFTLPDNITSWRVTSQAISEDLGAGVGVANIPVSLPVFTQVNIGDEYLSKDKPIVKLRAFGEELNSDDEIKFTISAPSLGVQKSSPLISKPFSTEYYSLPDLPIGKHDLVYNLESKKGNDAIKLPLNVISSRLEKMEVIRKKLSTTTTIKAPNDLPFAVILSDIGQNKLYPYIQNLSWSYGDRIDQRYIGIQSRKLLNKYYQEDYRIPDFKAFNYQVSEGGITLLPYSDSDLELSLRVALTGAENFDKKSLSQYFFKKLEDKNSNKEEVSLALAGLASLGKPVLPRIDTWLERNDLEVKEKLYLALGLSHIGAKEKAEEIYNKIIKTNARVKKPHIAIKVKGDWDDTFKSTALGAVLAASLGAEEAEGLFDYLVENQDLYGQDKNSERLFNLEKYNYIKKTLPELKVSPAEVKYDLYDKEKKAEITGGGVHSFQLSPRDTEHLNFTSVKGDVGMAIRYIKDFNSSEAEKDSSISLERKYYVEGKPTNTFSEEDTVEVRLYPEFDREAFNGFYQITDILPSGLAPATRVYTRGSSYGCNYWYPYNTDGQKVKYRVHKEWKNNYCGGDYLYYYARVKNPGTYKAEPAVMQAFINPDFVNYSHATTIKINKSK